MPGLLRGAARTAVVAVTAVPNRVSRRQGQGWAANQPRQHETPQAPPQPAAPPPAGGGDRIPAVNQLGELRDGVHTEDEFTAKFTAKEATILAW
jgi:hypothetical protein